MPSADWNQLVHDFKKSCLCILLFLQLILPRTFCWYFGEQLILQQNNHKPWILAIFKSNTIHQVCFVSGFSPLFHSLFNILIILQPSTNIFNFSLKPCNRTYTLIRHPQEKSWVILPQGTHPCHTWNLLVQDQTVWILQMESPGVTDIGLRHGTCLYFFNAMMQMQHKPRWRLFLH